MPTASIQTIFQSGYRSFEGRRLIPKHFRDAAHALMTCRTAVLGGHAQSCPDKHFSRIWYNSCKHRLCPQCAFLQVQRWLEKQKLRILKCDHYHVIFTIPDTLRDLWSLNRKQITNLMFQCARDTIFDLLEDKKHLGAKPGIIASFHTWTKTLLIHPHVHCLVTGGGLTPEGKWEGVTKSYLFPFALARDLFRGKMIDAIMKALLKGELTLPNDMRTQQLINYLNKLGRKKWNVRVCEKYSHGNGVLTYLARYLRGGPIHNSRIMGIRDGKVLFNCGRGEKKLMELKVHDFIARFLQHTHLPNAVMVRSYGLYSPSKKEDLDRCRAELGQEPVEEAAFIDWQSCFEQSDHHPERCPECGKGLVITAILQPTGIGAKYLKGEEPDKSSYQEAA